MASKLQAGSRAYPVDSKTISLNDKGELELSKYVLSELAQNIGITKALALKSTYAELKGTNDFVEISNVVNGMNNTIDTTATTSYYENGFYTNQQVNIMFALGFEENTSLNDLSNLNNQISNGGIVWDNENKKIIKNSGQYLTANSITNHINRNNDWSISFFVKGDYEGIQRGFFGLVSSISNGINFWGDSFLFWNAVSSYGYFPDFPNFYSSTFNFFTLTKQGNLFKIYKNGVYVASYSYYNSVDYSIFQIGVKHYQDISTSGSFEMKEFLILNKALNQDEINFLYNSGNGRTYTEIFNQYELIENKEIHINLNGSFKGEYSLLKVFDENGKSENVGDIEYKLINENVETEILQEDKINSTIKEPTKLIIYQKDVKVSKIRQIILMG